MLKRIDLQLGFRTDPLFGLDYFYQLIRHDKVVYNGITNNPVKDRIADHIGVKDFT